MSDAVPSTYAEKLRFGWSLHAPLRLAERRFLLICVDLLIANGALLAAMALRYSRGLDVSLILEHPLWFAILSASWLLAASASDTYHPRVAEHLQAVVPAVVKAGAQTTLIYLLIPFLTPALPSSRLALASLFLVITAAILAWRSVYAIVLPQPILQHRVLVVGTGSAASMIVRTLLDQERGSYQPVGFIDDEPMFQGGVLGVGGSVGSEATGGRGSLSFPVLGGRHQILAVITRYRVTTLVVALSHRVDPELLQTLMTCVEKGIDVIPMSVLYEQLTGRVPVPYLAASLDATLAVQQLGMSVWWRFVKRLMDVALSGFGLLCLGAIFPAIALAIYLDSPGPILYSQQRVGKGGRIFSIFKFRTMVPNAENGIAVWTQEDDPRVTRVGRLLRGMHLDEWPQFLNILKGEMSAVGPRPERPEFVAMIAAKSPLYPLRHMVKPGMAGWALVKQGYAATVEDSLIRLQYDLYYVKHQSPWFDLVILLKTLEDALSFRGR